jgi:hypothetical protein
VRVRIVRLSGLLLVAVLAGVLSPKHTASAVAAGWTTVVDDQFDAGGVPAHWHLYNGPYGSGPKNCAIPSHVTVTGGSMHMLMSYQATGSCGAGWYSAGMQIDAAYGTIDQRLTVRYRVIGTGYNGGAYTAASTDTVAHRIIPMRWPATAPWPQGGEEDYCESSTLSGCTTFLHYATTNSRVSHAYTVDLTQWHTMRFERLNHVVKAYIDDMTTPVWTYNGSSTTLPDTVKRAVLQQECRSSCPPGTAGTEDIQVDWITIENPA